MPSKAFGSQKAQKAHLLRGSGGVAAEVADVRSDADEAFVVVENKTGFPELQWIDGGAIAAAGGTAVLKGADFLQGKTFDELQLTEGAADLTFTAMKPGDSGLKVAIIAGAGALSVAYASKTLTITLASGGSTDDAIATAVNALADSKGIIRAVSAAGGSFTAAVAATDLAGGTGDWDNTGVFVSGVEAKPLHATGTTPAATWADGQISVTVPDLTAETDARAVGDIASVIVQSNAVKSNTLANVLA